MTSDKKTVSLLTDIFVKKGLQDIVLSPGSRNAPLVLSFTGHPAVKAVSVIDERSAAFFALGMAQQLRRTVAIACTSGSAVLNYAPAIAEAYYQKIPLLILTADRPPHLIDVGDGQTIRQNNVFANYIKKSFTLPLEISSEEEKQEVNRLINEAIDQTQFPEPGPVHINIPLDEPLYNLTEIPETGTIEKTIGQLPEPSGEIIHAFLHDWRQSRKTLILAGQGNPSEKLNRLMERLAQQEQVAVMTETTSNLHSPAFMDEIDNLITAISEDELTDFQPDLLITFGTAVVSKKIKKLLRTFPAKKHWHISPSGEKRDTYFCLSGVVKTDAESFFTRTENDLTENKSHYRDFWKDHKQQVLQKRNRFLSEIPWCDLKVYDILFREIPANSHLHLGNSTPVRYAQLFGSFPKFRYFSNRGVSGIDGQVSTAAGNAFAETGKINTIITGDIGFLYDSNALMNQNLTPNLKIIVMNNGGGDIFRFIPGPDTSRQREKFFATSHPWEAKNIAQAFDIRYFSVRNETELTTVLQEFYAVNRRPALLEIFTNEQNNAQILKDYFRFLES
ncbi:2-succinyl-5-enolpyruvyl-6-hydroxy-3-cyclohexene-1-carboxylic-acid synthase [Candidatus Sulfidibacterium hydrothermale]|uniref:2-succinyl-5-enolpyruvyl-6-hydroxy-3- cyclohexene-1-carboxylic-acid synthase n=1 Tax=Candidatus Sulfidibacterium hydrothermale TaxID=2875962 RepID=UPI001F0AF883|nr:2-succinyl-5-enolpyruvyl-6-hydroxy-3-cyclohexene-1-carboxylic-acid synthase [Candidatus Sulfidibacterium hydrothermale]UBM62936.1 2-succinyl-5-enolpyruvyl-6-hydroxy-3-cyclohexene-1-carboxylic-acid synthase [Candidatus Sulfidibacterium hydrothermale]